jgi:hypothetical protein
MAAGLGFKTFNTGDVLSAADVNGYLMQGVLVFASTAARDAAITAPAEGQFAFTKDTNGLWYYDGAAWVASGATGDIEGVTAGTGISGGGTSGTVTVTNSMATAIDAKGDLIGGTGADTFARLAVGANDTVLTADSSTATGLKWAAAAAGGGFVGCVLTKTANQSINNLTGTLISWDSELKDTNAFHDNSTNNTRITIPAGKGGLYLITGQVSYAANSTGYRAGTIKKNGSDYYVFWNARATDGEWSVGSVSNIIELAATDYLEMNTYHNAGTAININGGNTYGANFGVQYLGA